MVRFLSKNRIVGLALLAVLGLGTGAGLLLQGRTAQAETKPTAPPKSNVEAPAHLEDAAGLEAFVDGIMEEEMNRLHIPGAVISIVKDGRIILGKGYGSSNLEQALPVDAATSMFRIASTTKLFTWTAVMQLVEQGKIDLDADINTYLTSMQIPDTYPEPITMRHLMTHTAGFEEGGVGYQITTDPAALPGSISDTLSSHRLARIRPPGEMSAYSNYGAALAGLIVEEVSGMSYDDYIQKYLFDPLDMQYSTVAEPLPESFAPYGVVGYQSENDSWVPGIPTFEGGFRPAGSGTVSAIDMAHFMIAHLQSGTYGDRQILKPETAALMHTTAFQFDKRLPGVTLGFAEKRINGLTLITHGGSDPMFNTEFYLAPTKQLGIFLSYNGGPGSEAAAELVQELFDRYYPAPEAAPSEAYASAESVQKYAGSYRFTRRNISDIDKFFNFFAQLNIAAAGNTLSLGSGSEQQRYREIAPDLFQLEGGADQIGFRTDKSGRVTHMMLDIAPDMPLERMPLLDRSGFWLLVIGSSAFFFLTALPGPLLFRKRFKAMTPAEKRAVRLSAGTASWALLSVITMFGVVMSMDTMQKFSGIPPLLSLSLIMPLITAGLTLALLISTAAVWRNKYWKAWERVHYTLVTLSAVGLTFFFHYWNLLGWQFG
ncbi:serine hydrolase domain-containing protein [Saccharibacillus qingshengii]|uniref:serine hydrolase domain-containing protein n=1 Tax=Saccharibacillus qingshengii TaxID=1763540 RepID=UPI001556A9D8|nr:serine hydrolase domain-containing protein [Saccharibacillus qingshengii]